MSNSSPIILTNKARFYFFVFYCRVNYFFLNNYIASFFNEKIKKNRPINNCHAFSFWQKLNCLCAVKYIDFCIGKHLSRKEKFQNITCAIGQN